MHPTIFVSIASYRDPDCQTTVGDLFAKATFPERIVIGVCLQIVRGEDADCLVESERPEQLRIIEVPASESRGACWARSRVQSLWRGEDYFFQVDSHMRFVVGWDERLISMLAACPGLKPVLSTYPLAFTPPDTFAHDKLVTIRPKGFDQDGVLAQNSSLSTLNITEALQLSPFISAGMLFTLGRVVEKVPYDPHLYFTGEEITLGVRLWTHGWDIYRPNQVIAYHNYTKQPERPRHWADQTDWGQLGKRSRQRICHLLEVEATTDPGCLIDIERYGLGSARTLAAYETFSELDFTRRLFKGVPIPLPALAADQPAQIDSRRGMFVHIWKSNFWGNAETRSGSGSSMSGTVGLREWLPTAFESLGIRILGDAGCGDLNWMKELTPSLRLYLGFDIVPDLVLDLRSRFKDRQNCFFTEADVVTTTLPECDAILCRDCLTHLTPDAALMALKAFRRSGSRYLIATTHNGGHNVWIKNGAWYAMDLTAAPFNLPPPRQVYAEGGSKRLGVWSLADIL